jgi:glycosyltransferase involved in cell wall biosynthesis
MENSLKILLVNTRHFYGGGDSTYTFNLAELLSSRGHGIAFFAMQDKRNLPDPNADLFVSTIDFRELNQHKTLANGVKVLARTIYSAEARRKFAGLLDRFSPDIIHLQNFFRHITPSIVFEARQRGLPVVWTLHDYWLACPNSHFLIDRTGEICEACRGGRFYQAAFKRCKKDSLLASGLAALEAYCSRWMRVLKKVDAFVTPSGFLKSKLIENGFDVNHMHHLPLFLPQRSFWEGEQDQGYFLFLGKLEAIKGIDVLIEAARRAREVPIKIAGIVGEPLASRLPGILPENAEHVGLKHGKELADLIHNALAVVLPSIWYENQPFSILEAFASGKPVIASDLGGMTELVAHRERGLLVKPGDPAALADALQWAAANRTLMKAMGRNARHYALKHHSPESHYHSLMDIYSRVCAAARSGAPMSKDGSKTAG